MPDEPELKEEDPIDAIRGALTRALDTLKKLLGKEEEEIKEEMEEVEAVVSSGQPTDQQSDKESDQQSDTK